MIHLRRGRHPGTYRTSDDRYEIVRSTWDGANIWDITGPDGFSTHTTTLADARAVIHERTTDGHTS